MRPKTARGAMLGLTLLFAAPWPSLAQKTIETRRLELRIQETLIQRLGEDARTIQVSINKQKAFLSGTVNERVTQELAKEVVLSFDQIRSATNRIDARKTPTIIEGQAFLEGQDAELELRVNRAVAAALGPLAKAIEIEVVEGVASLRGKLPDEASAELARTTVREVSGIRQILDLLKATS